MILNIYSRFLFLSEINVIHKQTISTKDSSFDDLKNEIENLKNEIKSIKQNEMICDHRLTLIPPIILGTPFINAIYPLTSINAKVFSRTMDRPWVTKARGRQPYCRKGKIIPRIIGDRHISSCNSPIIQRGGMSMVNLKTSQRRLLLQYIWKIFQKIIRYMHNYRCIYLSKLIPSYLSKRRG
ncbi:hypothetical protein H5410_060455 [Solanum commersonii]|uniref:Uncharacterized protein n=1 Tax=Solanum commersonii TaxID=4109 RepID=A0A9J5W5H1_SOLCO|nr:hypothetical protein H5410_060455 [Solanum commersonii]